MFIFLLVYITSFVVAFREVIKGNRAGILTYMIFGLSTYTTAMCIAFSLGLKSFIPFFQSFKELLVFTTLILNVINLKTRPRLHLIDYLILTFLVYTVIYALLPIGEQSLVNRLIALKSLSFFILVYFTGRFQNPVTIYVKKYFSYIIILTIAAGAVLLIELSIHQQLQSFTGYADYIYYFLNIEPDGIFGLTSTFQSEGGYMRFASFFTNPLEHATATVVALAVILGLYTRDDNKFNINGLGLTALFASFLSIIFAFSRAPLVSYLLMIYVYAIITNKKIIIKTTYILISAGALYLVYLFSRFEDKTSGIIEIVMHTILFSNPSSIGHIEQWVTGIISIIDHPMGLGVGSSGRTAGGDNVGGENQFIVIAVQAGIIAAGIYLAIIVNFIKTSLKWLPRLKGKERKVCITALFIKIGLFISLLTSEVEGASYISYMNWFLSGLLISIIMQYKPPQILSENVY